MQINRVGWLLLAMFGIGGAVFALFGPTRLLGIIWVLVAVGLGVFAWREARKARHQQWVFRTGLRTRATVLEASSSATVNEMPLMRLVLELDVPGHGASRVAQRLVMPVFCARRMQPGLVLPAYVNPTDPEDFVLVW
jgi:hypothetical protein